MFEVGERYEFRMIEGDNEVQFWGRIESYEHPLIKIEDTKMQVLVEGGETKEPDIIPGQIINVTSPNFISARKRRD